LSTPFNPAEHVQCIEYCHNFNKTTGNGQGAYKEIRWRLKRIGMVSAAEMDQNRPGLRLATDGKSQAAPPVAD
jgi:hypothetical protein